MLKTFYKKVHQIKSSSKSIYKEKKSQSCFIAIFATLLAQIRRQQLTMLRVVIASNVYIVQKYSCQSKISPPTFRLVPNLYCLIKKIPAFYANIASSRPSAGKKWTVTSTGYITSSTGIPLNLTTINETLKYLFK